MSSIHKREPPPNEQHVQQEPAPAVPAVEPAGVWARPDPMDEILAPNSTERLEAVVCHVGGYLLSFILPLIMLLAKREGSRFVSHHAREALNFQITLGLVALASILMSMLGLALEAAAGTDGWLIAVGVFWLILVVLVGTWETVMIVLAAVAAYRGQAWYYPLTIRIVR